MTKDNLRKPGAALPRRSFLIGAGATLGAAATSLPWFLRRAQAAGRSIVWGTNEAYSRPQMLQPFTDETGIDVELALFSDPAEVVTKIQAGGAGVHILLDGSYHVEISYTAGVLKPLNIDNVPNWKHVIPAFRNADGLFFDGQQYGVPIIWGTDSLVYRGDLVGGDIDDIGALFDKQYAGRIAMPGGLFESLIVAAIYLGYDKPFSMSKDQLDEVVDLLVKQKPLVRTYWNDIGDLKNLMATGEVVLSWGWAPVLELKSKDDIDVRWGFPKQGQLGWYDASYLTIEAEGQTQEDSEKFINYVLGDYYGVALAEDAGYRTVSGLAIDKMDPKLKADLHMDEAEKYLSNTKWWVTPNDSQAYQDAWDRVLNA